MKAAQRDDDTEGCDSATPTMAKSKSPPVNHSPALGTQDLKCKIQEHYQSGALHVGYFNPHLCHGICRASTGFQINTNLKYMSRWFSLQKCAPSSVLKTFKNFIRFNA